MEGWGAVGRRFFLLSCCWVVAAGAAAAPARRTLTLATTTSTQDTGLLDVLGPRFEKQTGIVLRVVAVGTGQALELGRRGDAEVLLVHARAAEDRFIAEGHGVDRRDVMYNDFVLVGPASDPARIRGLKPAAALGRIARAPAPFVSRGDNSGTHLKEQELWKSARLAPAGAWYLKAGAGMAEALRMAAEKDAYTLSDRATYLALWSRLKLRPLVEKDPNLFNPYGVIAVNPKRHAGVNIDGARRFIRFLLSPEIQAEIARFGRAKHGQPLYYIYRRPGRARTGAP